jgi:hypothetical protein
MVQKSNLKMKFATTLVPSVVTMLVWMISQGAVDAFARCTTTCTTDSRLFSTAPDSNTRTRHSPSMVLFSNNSNDKDDIDWISERVERASFSEICRDSVLVMCYVLCRFFIYDIATGIKSVPGWELQDLVYLTGTFSSAIALVTYWTVAGLLSRSFENSGFNPIQTLVNVALCCPIWLATEHLFEFGPPGIAGSALGEAVLTGFLSMSSAMILGRVVTSQWE